MYNEELEGGPTYLIEGDAARYRVEAEKALGKAKLQESKKKIIPVWADRNTIKLIDIEKIKRFGLQIIRVKIPGGRIVWMEKKVAIKNGFINE